MSMESSPTNYQHTSRLSSGLNTMPSLSISTSTSCVSSVLSTSPVTSDSPYYYYTSPTSASSSPTTTTTNTPCPLRQSHRPMEKRSHSASVRLRRRTSIPLLPPQRSASAGSTLIKDTSSSTHHHQQQHYRPSFHRPTEKMDTTTLVDLPPPKEQRWDDSQLAMELADDLPSSPTLSTRENIKIKVRQWITPNTKQRRRPIHKWFSDRMA